MKPQISGISGDSEFDTLINDYLDAQNLIVAEIGKINHHNTGWTIDVTLQASGGYYHYFTLYWNETGYGFTCDSFASKIIDDFCGVKKRPDGTHETRF